MHRIQTIQIYKTGTGFAVAKNTIVLRRVFDRQHATRIAKQVFNATKKLTTGPVYYDDFTHFISDV